MLLGVFRVFAYLAEGARPLEASVYVPLVVTVTSAACGLAVTLYSQAKTRRREIEAAFRERKIEIYWEFLEALARLQMNANERLKGAPIDENDLARKLIEIRTKAVLWGSQDVLIALEKMGKPSEAGVERMFHIIEDIQRAMRSDLGLPNWKLGQRFFIRLMLNEELDWTKIKGQ
ncbi:MAG: hypothetical protein AAF647_08150 [Pseudomonadota bacterium]